MASIDISEERGVRYLHFGSHWVQGAMRIARPYALEFEYMREMMLPLLLRTEPGWPATVLQIGLGSASHTKFLHRYRPEARITVIEIDPNVVTAARHFFKLPDESEHLRIVIGEGHEFLSETRRRFDLIIVDGFDDKGRTGMLDTVPFYLECLQHLSATGMVSINYITRRRGIDASAGRLREVFGPRMLILPATTEGNTVGLAAGGRPIEVDLEELRVRAATLKTHSGLDLKATFTRLAAVRGGASLVL